MKKVVISIAALSMFTAAAFAGSLVEPEMEPMVEVMEEEPGSSNGLLVPLLALVAFGLIISSSDSDSAPDS
jgi:hypothetical protein